MRRALLKPLVVGSIAFLGLEARALTADNSNVALSLVVAAMTAGISLLGLNATVKLLAATGQVKQARSTILLGASLFKLPMVGAGLYVGLQLAEGHEALFAATLALVYLCAVWFLAARRE